MLTCVATNDESPIAGPRTVLAEILEEGEVYYVLVHGIDTSAGEFALVVDTLDPEPNDACPDAIELDDRVSGGTFAATADGNLTLCGV